MIDNVREDLLLKLESLQYFEEVKPKFQFQNPANLGANLVSISNGSVYYEEGTPILLNINLNIGGGESVVIEGKNASGKTTLLKAILGFDEVLKSGEWNVMSNKDIGYLNQTYGNLVESETAFESLKKRSSLPCNG